MANNQAEFEALQRQIALLQAQNAALVQKAEAKVRVKISPVTGVVMLTGLRSRPISCYREEWHAIEQNLTDLHAQAVSVGDLGTARQCLVDLGKEKGMFTPVQKIRFETVDDLNLDDTEALIRKLMAAKEAESTPVVPDEEPASAELVQ